MRRLLKIGAPALAILAIAAAAWAYWSGQGTGTASASVATLNAPTNVSGTATTGSSTVAVSWTASALSTGAAAQGYYVTRTSGSTATAACGSSASHLVTTTNCSDTNVPDGTYTYKVTAVYHSWTAQASAANTTTVQGDATPPSVSVGFPGGSGPFRTATWNAGCATAGFCGTATDSASGVQGVEIAIQQGSGNSYWNGTSFVAGAQTFLPVSSYNSSTHAWSYGFPASNFPSDGSYTVYVRATDNAGNRSTAVSQTFTTDSTAPTVSVAKKSGQADPTNSQPINYTITLSEAGVSDLTASNVTVTAPAGNTGVTKTLTKTDSTHYNVAVSGLKTDGTGDGTISASVAANAIQDAAGNGSAASNTASVAYDTLAPTVSVAKKSGQADPTNSQPINYTITLSEVGVSDLAASSVSVSAPAANTGLTKTLTKTDSTHYNVAVSGLKTDGTGDGSIGVSVTANAVQDAAGNGSAASNTSTVAWDTTGPSVSVAKKSGQADPTNSQPINYTITLGETPAADLQASGVAVSVPSGNTGVTKTLTKTDSTHYNVAVAGLKTDGTGDGNINVSVNANAIQDALGNGNAASSTATVVWDRTAPAVPTAVALHNGGGSSGTWINIANKASVSVDVTLPAGSVATDTVTVTLSDGTHTTTAKTAAASAGAGTVTVTGIDASTLNEGTNNVTISATSTDSLGNVSTAKTGTVSKDTAAPAAATNLSYTDGNGADKVAGNAENGATVTVTRTAPTAGSPFTGTSNGSFNISVDKNSGTTQNPINVTYSVVVTDPAGNSSSASTISFSDKQ